MRSQRQSGEQERWVPSLVCLHHSGKTDKQMKRNNGVWYLPCRKWKMSDNCVNMGVEEFGFSWGGTMEYWDGGTWTKTWRKRESQPYKDLGEPCSQQRKWPSQSPWGRKKLWMSEKQQEGWHGWGRKSGWAVRGWCEDGEVTVATGSSAMRSH